VTVTSAIVLYAVLWFLALFVALPIRVRTQGEDGAIVPGTPASAPTDPMLRGKLLWVTVAATALWAAICAVILWGGLTIDDIDVWGRR
jgi:predicted secreted protein